MSSVPAAAQRPRALSWAVLRGPVLWIGGAVLVAWGLNILWWGLLSPEAQAAGDTEIIEIPAGTYASISRGSPIALLPSDYSVPPGGKLLVHNLDAYEHRIGEYVIPPGGTAELSTSELGTLECTIHPSGYIGISLEKRPPFITTLALAIALGLPMGALAAGATAIAGRLDDGHSA